ncbi:hypothetical protein M427DRAFT_193104 [Gonapodya prolifera JEL478]|uniref:Uncharacterized protein n=1 Tax=Gonapodya prolifera (strain JEL478) TaxID=1344416 RepID=A0A138ZZQ8_GONPJ|nr:hypothetical protein M427DRAFT_193104 [Gonapodya prolifera JEL478]|eukprot:KXS09997.1 hypothetical protein M427DRAFT_193104 [Gonapodya prolifera JEL478]
MLRMILLLLILSVFLRAVPPSRSFYRLGSEYLWDWHAPPVGALLEFGVAVPFSRGPQNFIAEILNPGEVPVVMETSNVEEPGKEIDSKSTTSASECASLEDGPTVSRRPFEGVLNKKWWLGLPSYHHHFW